MKLSVIIPCYNEFKTIREIVHKLKNVPINEMEIIIVDDFSTDGTRELLKTEIEAFVEKVIYHEKNMGKGAALRTGFKEVTGNVVVVQDADMEYDPQELPLLMKPLSSQARRMSFSVLVLWAAGHIE